MKSIKVKSRNLLFSAAFSIVVLSSLGIFSLTPTKIALAAGCPGDMDYGTWTPDQKVTVFSPLPISHGIGLSSWRNPSGINLNLDVIRWNTSYFDNGDNNAEFSCNPHPGPSSAPSTVTILPTNYSITVNTLQRQSASGYGVYSWSYYDPNGNPSPTFGGSYGKPVTTPGHPEHYDFSAMCSGWQCYCDGSGFCTVGAQGHYDYTDIDSFPPFVENNLGYSVTANLPAISTLTFSADVAKQVQAEDSIINDIQNTGHIHVKVDTTSIGNSYTASIPATNCVNISGTGPKKIVFIRGTDWKVGISDFLTQAKAIRDQLIAIDPFKTYADQLSFFLDLNAPPENIPIGIIDGQKYFTSDSDNAIKSSSSCQSDALEYVLLFHDPDEASPVYTGFDRKVNIIDNVVHIDVPETLDLAAQLNNRKSVSDYPVTLPIIAVHESGHAIGKLNDEYIYAQAGTWMPGEPFDSYGLLGTTKEPLTNCANNTANSYRITSDGSDVWYGSPNTQNCMYASTPQGSIYYKPSTNSIINDARHSQKFNVISCGYLISGILGEPIDKAHAQTHWPECMRMDTEKPASLTAMMSDPPNIGKVNLSWSGISNNATRFQIERATDPNLSSFNLLTTVGSNASSYVDDLTTSPLNFSSEAYRVRGQLPNGAFSDYSNTASVSNCVKIAGDGPRKIVFMRGDTLTSTSVEDYMTDVHSIIGKFGIVEPFASYINQFSFYVDLKKLDESPLAQGGYVKFTADDYITHSSSCNGTDSIDKNAFEYIFFTGWQGDGTGWALNQENVVFLSRPLITSKGLDMSLTAMHESGHVIGNLQDEYGSYNTANPADNYSGDISQSVKSVNCALGEDGPGGTSGIFRSSLDNKWYGAPGTAGTFGCEGHYKNSTGISYYRPSFNSMMKDEYDPVSGKFNIISCGYLIAAIKGEPIDKDHAQTHWPAIDSSGPTKQIGCMYMAMQQDPEIGGYDQLPPVSLTPKIISISRASASVDSDLSLSGSGFTPTENAVQFTNTDTGEAWDMPDIASSNGTILTAAIPADLIPGHYSLKVGSFNSPWSNSIPVTITAGPIASPSPSPSPMVSPLNNVSNSGSQTHGYSITPSTTPYPTPSSSVSSLPTVSVIPTPTPTPSLRPSPTYSSTPTPTPSRTSSPTPSPKPSSTPSPTPTSTSSPSPSPAAVSWNGSDFTAAIINVMRTLGQLFGGQ